MDLFSSTVLWKDSSHPVTCRPEGFVDQLVHETYGTPVRYGSTRWLRIGLRLRLPSGR